ncbi:MAG: hypothetical protein JEZ12_25115 [Desulfobacterium sp.]|nr:hypothetical protein [Desulfobacterium sp.]
MQRRTVAVVTGDVNASTRMLEEDARRLEHVLNTCFQDVVSALADAKAAGFTNFRGDSWQFVIGDPGMAVRATLFFRSSLLVHSNQEFGKRIHTSASIGFGSIKYMPSETSLAGGGKAYEYSGKRLDKLRRRVPGMGVAGLGEIDLFMDSLLGVVDALAHHWTALQAQAVSFALQGLAQVEIAKKWNPPISQQAVHKHLLSAGWPAIEPALRWMETTLKGCIAENNPERLSEGETHER